MNWLYIIVGVVIVGLIVYFAMGKKKGGPQGPAETPPTMPPTE